MAGVIDDINDAVEGTKKAVAEVKRSTRSESESESEVRRFENPHK